MKQEAKKVKTVQVIAGDSLPSQEVTNLLKKFVGLKSQMNEKFQAIREQDLSENDPVSKTPKKKNYRQTVCKSLLILSFFLMFVLTLINLFLIKPTEKTFHLQKSFEKKFKPSKSYSSAIDLKDTLNKMISPLFEESEDSLVKDNTNILINALRIGYYKTQKIECGIDTDNLCFSENYNSGTAETIKGSIYLSEKLCNYNILILDEKNTKFFPSENNKLENSKYVILDAKRNNIIEKDDPYQELQKYLNEVFSIAIRSTNKIKVNVNIFYLI
jgi:hypothetical protein